MAAKEAATAKTSAPHETKQPTVAVSFTREQPYSRGSKKWKELTDSVVRCLVKDMLPLPTVEKEGFKLRVHALDPRYELPSGKYLAKKAIPTLYSTTRATVEVEIATATFFLATTDM